MDIDERYGYITDADGNRYQVLTPIQTVTTVVGFDEDGKEITEVTELPRDVDAAATAALAAKGTTSK